MSLVALLVVSLFIAAFQTPPQHDRSLHQFVGTETCKITDQGKVLDKETIQKTMNMKMVCVDKTDDPWTSGTVKLTLKEMWNNPKNNNAGWGWFEFRLKNDYTTWYGYRVGVVSTDGVTFTNGWGFAKGGEPRGTYTMWRFTDETPSVIHGWYEDLQYPPGTFDYDVTE
jgi:hypothetical protein